MEFLLKGEPYSLTLQKYFKYAYIKMRPIHNIGTYDTTDISDDPTHDIDTLVTLHNGILASDVSYSNPISHYCEINSYRYYTPSTVGYYGANYIWVGDFDNCTISCYLSPNNNLLRINNGYTDKYYSIFDGRVEKWGRYSPHNVYAVLHIAKHKWHYPCDVKFEF